MSDALKPRLKGKWKHKAFTQLVERDGETCSMCGESGRTIWRQMGVWNGGDWEMDAVCRNRYTHVHPTSNLEVDHKHALRDGGTNDLSNLWLLCIGCHKVKSAAERTARAGASK